MANAKHLKEELGCKDARLREIEAAARTPSRHAMAARGELAAAIEQGAAAARHLQEELSAWTHACANIEASMANAEQARLERARVGHRARWRVRQAPQRGVGREEDARLREIEGADADAERARFDARVAANEKESCTLPSSKKTWPRRLPAWPSSRAHDER